MKRIKAIGLAVVLALALSAVAGASGASASSKFTSNSYPTSYVGTEGVGGFTLSAGNGSVTVCQGSITGSLSAASESMDGYLGSPKCSASGYGGTLKTNGCKFVFHSGSDNASFGTSKGTFDIGPAGCGPMTVPTMCGTVSYPAQTGFAATFENVGGKEVRITLNGTGMSYSRTAGICGGAASFENGELNGTWTAKSTGASTLQVVQDPHEPKFEAESYPAAISGSQVGSSIFNANGFKNECKKGTVASSLSAATPWLGLSPSYSECKFAGIPSTVVMNGCVLWDHVESKVEANKFTGSMEILCPAGKAIEIKAGNPASPVCTATIGAQGALSGVTLENAAGPSVKAISNLSGIQYSLTKHTVTCPINQAIGQTVNYANGTYTDTVLTESPDLRVGG